MLIATLLLGLGLLQGTVSLWVAALLLWLLGCALAWSDTSTPETPERSGSPRRLPGPE